MTDDSKANVPGEVPGTLARIWRELDEDVELDDVLVEEKRR